MIALATLLWLSPLARAQDAAPAEAPPARKAPPVAVIGFQDRADDADCDPVEARHGRCVERVDLLDPATASAGQGDHSTLAAWRTVSRLSWKLWEDMAHQGFGENSPLAQTLLKAGFELLPDNRQIWETAHPDGRHVVSVPASDTWLGAGVWGLSPDSAGGRVWRPLRTHEPAGLPALPPTVLLAGRFALRLGFDGHPHDYDLMDADPASSGPFFEQLYPFRRASDRAALQPLSDFDLPDALSRWLAEDPVNPAARAALAPTLLARGDYQELSQAASRQFQGWARLLGVQIAQYAVADYTANQMRVLAALTTMRSAPGSLEQRTGRTRDLVAAALGQTDSSADLEAQMDPSVFALQGGFALHYEQLPPAVVRDWLVLLHGKEPADFVSQVDTRARELLGELLRSEAPALSTVEPDALSAWCVTALRPGADPERFANEIARLALSILVDGLPEGERDRAETWILLDHVQFAISSGLDATGQTWLSPDGLSALATSQWTGVLRQHGYHTRAISQGLGAVDPASICTTGDGAAARDESTVGVVNLDLLISAPRGLSDPQQALWAARDQVPVLAVDDPSTSPPELSWLVDLPGDTSLYRVRWRLWTGWHLLWDAQPLPGDSTRLAARTAAICEDLALAPADLVPTVLRAGLLEGELRPTVPVYRADLRGRQKAPKTREELDPDALVAQGADAVSAGSAAKSAVQGSVDAFKTTGSPSDLASSAAGLFSGGGAAGLPDEGSVSARVRWLRELLRPRLEARAADSGGMLLEVIDLDDRGDVSPIRDAPPRTPYLRAREARGPGAGRGAAWLLWLDGPEGLDATRLSPETRPRASVSTEAPMPRWRHPWAHDYALAGSLGLYPWRLVDSTCNSDSDDLDVVASCADRSVQTQGQGLSADLLALATFWSGGRTRLGLEGGLAVQLDAGLPGTSWLSSADTTDYDWTLRPSTGVVAGLRWAPRPASLWGRGASTWGAALPDGEARDGRSQLGLRAGFLTGPSYNGADAAVYGELWWARALRRDRARSASITPYYPNFVLGPYARWQYGFPLIGGGDELLVLDDSQTVTIGVRGWIRRSSQASLPETSP